MLFDSSLLETFRQANALTLFLDYDGTLVDFCDDPDQVLLPKSTYELLLALVNRRGYELIIVTGRDRNYMARTFSNLPITIYAEHGACVSHSRQSSWHSLVDDKTNWLEQSFTALKAIVKQFKGAWLESKPQSLCLHYGNSSMSPIDAKKIIQAFDQDARFSHLDFMDAYNHIDCRLKSVSKANAIHHYFKSQSNDLCLAMGDDVTDIAMFDAVKHYDGYTFAVGDRIQQCDYRLGSVSVVTAFLNQLI